jgi:transcriptional regulator with XRE-family HTH domain
MTSQAATRIRRTPPPELGPMLRAARERKGIGQRQASASAGLGRSYVGLVEAGRRTPSRVAAEQLAEALDLTEGERGQLYAAAVTDAGRSHPWRSTA